MSDSPLILVCNGTVRNRNNKITGYQFRAFNRVNYQALLNKSNAYDDGNFRVFTPAELRRAVQSGNFELGFNVRFTPAGRLEVAKSELTGYDNFTKLVRATADDIISQLEITYNGYVVKQMEDSSSVCLSGVKSRYLPDFKSIAIMCFRVHDPKEVPHNELMITPLKLYNPLNHNSRATKEFREAGDYQISLALNPTDEQMLVAKQRLCAYTAQHLKTTKRGEGYNYQQNYHI